MTKVKSGIRDYANASEDEHSILKTDLFQYIETNVMHFIFSLLRIYGLYMFRALLAHPQKVLHKQHLVYCVSIYVSWLHQGAAN
jgi:hypothetical protein